VRSRPEGRVNGTDTRGPTIRPARLTDTASTSRVFAAAVNELYRRRGVGLVLGDDSRRAVHDHLLETDPQRFFVAEREGHVVAFSAALDRGSWWFLSCLFVLPREQGAGLGGRLLRAAAAARPVPGGVGATITNALQPVSNTLYARRGLFPWLALVGLTGTPRRLAPPALGRLDVVALGVDDVVALAEVDQAAAGADRSVDHAWYLGAGGRRGWLFLRAGRPAGYVYVSQEGAIGPAATLRPADMEPLYVWAIAQAAGADPAGSSAEASPQIGERSHGGGTAAASPATAAGLRPVTAIVPGPCVAAQRALWEAGLRFGPDPGLLLASRPFGRPDRFGCGSFALM
jgi:GNAT superfamily N-acetyltransferase